MTARAGVVGSPPASGLSRMVSSAVLVIGLYAVAALAWWLSVTASMPAGTVTFLAGWLVMMTAMMLPALVPVLTLYQRAARRRTVAPVPVFVAGYLLVWSVPGLPVYAASRQIQPAMAAGQVWPGVAAGVVLLLAAAYQLTPLKAACLRGCRSPLTAFTSVRGSMASPVVSLRVGARNGLWCLGCCWALLSVLVAVGVAQPWWMAGVAALIFAEKALPFGPRVSMPSAVLLAAAGVALLAQPASLASFTV